MTLYETGAGASVTMPSFVVVMRGQKSSGGASRGLLWLDEVGLRDGNWDGESGAKRSRQESIP